MKTRTVLLALTLLAGACVVVVAATAGSDRPPLNLPAASAFPAGPCRDAAGAVLALGRFTYEHEDAATLPASAYPFLRQRAEELAGVRNALSGSPSASAGAGENSAVEDSAAAAGDGTVGEQAVGEQANSEQAVRGQPVGEQPDAGDGLEQALSRRLQAVLTAIGFVRLRPGKAYDPQLLRDLERARAELQQTCLSRRD